MAGPTAAVDVTHYSHAPLCSLHTGSDTLQIVGYGAIISSRETGRKQFWALGFTRQKSRAVESGVGNCGPWTLQPAARCGDFRLRTPEVTWNADQIKRAGAAIEVRDPDRGELPREQHSHVHRFVRRHRPPILETPAPHRRY